MHLLLSSVMHTVELAETKETKERDYQGYWEKKKKQQKTKNKHIRFSGLEMNPVFCDFVGSCCKYQTDLLFLERSLVVAQVQF